MAFFTKALSASLIAVATSSSPVVRRESAMHGAELIYNKGDSKPASNAVNEAALKMEEELNTMINTCNEDYPLGIIGESKCKEPGFDHLILNREMCIQASKEAGVMTVHAKFDLQEEGGWQWLHPMGCFKVPCDEAVKANLNGATDSNTNESHEANGFCYFYNPIGVAPDEEIETAKPVNVQGKAITGTPVCARPKLILGSIDPETNIAKCKEGWDIVGLRNQTALKNDDDCKKAADCLGKCEAQHFNINNEVNSKFDDYPPGCFIEESTACVYMNPVPKNYQPNPKAPVGTPICMVTQPTIVSSKGWAPSAEDVLARGAAADETCAEKAAGGAADQTAAGSCGAHTCTDATKHVDNRECAAKCEGDECDTKCCVAAAAQATPAAGAGTTAAVAKAKCSTLTCAPGADGAAKAVPDADKDKECAGAVCDAADDTVCGCA